MFVISSEYGPALIFDDVSDIERVIKDLKNQVEYIKSNDVEPRYVYLTAHDEIPKSELNQQADWLKWIVSQDLEYEDQETPSGLLRQ